jgi:hypothetical protein
MTTIYQVLEGNDIRFETPTFIEAEEVLLMLLEEGANELDTMIVEYDVPLDDDEPHSFLFDEDGKEIDVDALIYDDVADGSETMEERLAYGEANYPDYEDH